MANSAQIGSEIQILDRQLTELFRELDATLVRARKDLVAPATAWIKGTIDAAINEHAGVVRELGIERVREFKGKVAALLERLPELVEQHTDDKSVWPHHVGRGKPRSDEGYFPSVYRDIISELGAILVEFNLAGATKQVNSTWKPGRGRYVYSINPMFDWKPLPNVSQYHTSLAEYNRLSVDRDNKKVDLQKAQARELFDSA